MRYIWPGIDIGNSSTEVATATLNEGWRADNRPQRAGGNHRDQGTLRNVFGIQEALATRRKAREGSMSAIFRSSALTKPRR